MDWKPRNDGRLQQKWKRQFLCDHKWQKEGNSISKHSRQWVLRCLWSSQMCQQALSVHGRHSTVEMDWHLWFGLVSVKGVKVWNNYMNTKESQDEDAAVNPSWSCLGYMQELQHSGTFLFLPFSMFWKMGRGKLDTCFKPRESKAWSQRPEPRRSGRLIT